MSTLADELLNDFEDSASEGEAESHNGFLHNPPSPPNPGASNSQPRATLKRSAGSMDFVDDEENEEEEEEEEEDEDTLNGDMLVSEPLDDAPDEEEAKAKVEKMQLGGVSDVRTVAGLMKTLEPVLEVGFPFPPSLTLSRTLVHLQIEDHDLHLP